MNSLPRVFLFAIVILSLPLLAPGKDKKPDRSQGVAVPEGWIVVAPPKTDKGTFRCDFFVGDEWRVTAPDGLLTINKWALPKGAGKSGVLARIPFEPPKESHGINHALKLSDGWLLGANHGEFGGG